ncbi:MAG: beta-ketoacyl-[acyl-carrier-protein] synthase family protein [Thermomicrobiales bacterium]
MADANRTGRRVVVTGMGAITALGLDLPTTWAALIAGGTGIAPITQFDATGFPTTFAAEVRGFDPAMLGHDEGHRMDRVTQFAVTAAREAIGTARLDASVSERMAVLVGTAMGGVATLSENVRILMEHGPDRVPASAVPMMLPNMTASTVAAGLGATGPVFTIASSFTGGANAIVEGARMIADNRADVAVAGGAEAPVCAMVSAGFAAMGALSDRNDDPLHAVKPFDRHRNGCVLGEGSAMLVLEEYEHALARGVTILAEVAGTANTADAFHQVALPDDGEGLVRAMHLAMDGAKLDPHAIGYLNAHGTATEMNDRVEAAAIHTVFGGTPPPISSTKAATGHTLGAAGALEAVIAIEALRTGILPPTRNHQDDDPGIALDVIPNVARQSHTEAVMSASMGFGGHNTVLIFTSRE